MDPRAMVIRRPGWRRMVVLGALLVLFLAAAARRQLSLLLVASSLASSNSNNQLLMTTLTTNHRHGDEMRPEASSSSDNSNNTQNKPIKFLVILIGSLRGGERAWQSLIDNVLDYHNQQQPHNGKHHHHQQSTTTSSTILHLALAVSARVPAHYQNATLFDHAHYHWPIPEFKDWGDAVDEMARDGGRDPREWRRWVFRHARRGSKLLGGIVRKTEENRNNTTTMTTNTSQHRYPGSVAMQMMSRYFVSRHIQRLNLTQEYDWFVVTRTDHYYLCPQNWTQIVTTTTTTTTATRTAKPATVTQQQSQHQQPPQNTIWLPQGEDFGGYTDRHVMASKTMIHKVLNIYPQLLFGTDRQEQQQIVASGLNPEGMVQRMWHNAGIRRAGDKDTNTTLALVQRFPRTMFTCASAHGPHDASSNLGRFYGQYLPKQDVLLKYKREYDLSRATCDVGVAAWFRQWRQWWRRRQGGNSKTREQTNTKGQRRRKI